MVGHNPKVGQLHRALQCLARSRAACCKQLPAPAVCQQRDTDARYKEMRLGFSFSPFQRIMPSPALPRTLFPAKITVSFPLFLRHCLCRKPLLSLALIFPSYLFFLSHLNSLIFLFQMKQPPLEAANLRPRWQDCNPLQNIISSIPIHLPSKPIPLCVYMPGPGRETDFLNWLCCNIFLAKPGSTNCVTPVSILLGAAQARDSDTQCSGTYHYCWHSCR